MEYQLLKHLLVPVNNDSSSSSEDSDSDESSTTTSRSELEDEDDDKPLQGFWYVLIKTLKGSPSA
jgi:hypothetical protein